MSNKEKREKFLKEFCKKMGWNPNELTTGQMLIISKNSGYSKPIINIFEKGKTT